MEGMLIQSSLLCGCSQHSRTHAIVAWTSLAFSHFCRVTLMCTRWEGRLGSASTVLRLGFSLDSVSKLETEMICSARVSEQPTVLVGVAPAQITDKPMCSV